MAETNYTINIESTPTYTIDTGTTGTRGKGATVSVGTTTTVPSVQTASVDNSGTSADAIFNFSIPKGSTWYNGVGTPSSSVGVEGDYYVNTDTNIYYEKTSSTVWAERGSAVGDVGVTTIINGVVSGTIDGSNTTFTLDDTYDNIIVYLNGLKVNTDDYTWTKSTKVLEFTDAPLSGYVIEANGIYNKTAEVVPLDDLATIAQTGNLSDANNDDNYVQDSDYVHTDNNLTDELVEKINEGGSSSEQVQADWSVTDDTSMAYILNKPTNVSDFNNDAGFITSFTESDPVFSASPAFELTSAQMTIIGNTSGTNTGDQDLSGYATTTALSNHTTNTLNPHSVTALQVGLGNCNNTSDLDKPISTVVQSALDLKVDSSDLADVATTGSYDDLSDTPSIPSKTSDLTNDSDFTTNAILTSALSNKVDTVSGKSLSTNDLTDALKSNYDAAYVDALASRQSLDCIYDGVDLSVKFATEIAASPYNGDVWAWIKARTQAANFTGIHVGDYIPVSISAGTVVDYTISAQTFNAQIAGIDTYWSYGDMAIVHHIDFITKTCLNTPIQWQPNDNNNGTANQANPWLTSKLYAVLNGVNNYSTNAYNTVAHGVDASAGGILQLLPTALQNAIIQKRQLLESRYSVSGLLTSSNTWAWADMGKLWLPNEFEVYGSQVWSHVYSNGNAVQYPLFAGAAGYKGRLKTNSGGSRVTWWLSVAISGYSTYSCYISSLGYAHNASCSYGGAYAPLCFRIG